MIFNRFRKLSSRPSGNPHIGRLCQMNLSNVSRHSLSPRHSWRLAMGGGRRLVAMGWKRWLEVSCILCRAKLQFVYAPSTHTQTHTRCESVGNKSNAAAESSTNYGELKVSVNAAHLLLFLRFRCMLQLHTAYCILQMELKSVRQSVSQPSVYHLPGTHAFHFSRRQLPCLPGQRRSPTIYNPDSQFPPSNPLLHFPALKEAAFSFLPAPQCNFYLCNCKIPN